MKDQSIEDLIIQIDEGNRESRIHAIKQLGMKYKPEVTPNLLRLLNDEDPKIRETSVITLGTIGDRDQIITPLVNQLNDPIIPVVLSVIKVLGELRTNKATKPLIKILLNENIKIQEAAVVALGYIGDKNSLFPLIDMLDSEVLSIKINSILALGLIADNRAVEPIIGLLKEESESIKKIAAFTLGKFNEESIIDPLISLLEDPEPSVKHCALLGLEHLNSSKIIDPIINLLNDKDEYIQKTSARILSKIKDKKVIDKFMLKLEDENVNNRQSAIRALGNIKEKSAVHKILGLLEDKNSKVRLESVQALGKIKDPNTTKKILKLISDPNKKVRIASLESVGKIEGDYKIETTFSGKIKETLLFVKLKGGLYDEKQDVKVKAAEALARIFIKKRQYKKASESYMNASSECKTWDSRQNFYRATAVGCSIMEQMQNNFYKINNIDKIFSDIYENLEGSAKILGIETYISYYYWKLLNSYINIINSETPTDFMELLRDIGTKFLSFSKIIPEELSEIIQHTQNELNTHSKIIEKKKNDLELSEAKTQIKKMEDSLKNLFCEIMVLEPLKIQVDETSRDTIHILDSLNLGTIDNIGDIKFDNDFTRKFSVDSIKSYSSTSSTPDSKEGNKFEIEKIQFGWEKILPQTIQISLIQINKGIRRLSLIEEKQDIWARYIKRYYDIDMYNEQKIFHYTKESILMRIKPKLIGFLDDVLWDGASIVILPELCVPENYIEKLQGFSDRYEIFIIAGIEHIQNNEGLDDKYHNRVMLFGPKKGNPKYKAVYQEKNYPNQREKTLKIKEWSENIKKQVNPKINVFETPFGRFIVLLGEEISQLFEYIPYITRENNLDFIIFLKNDFQDKILNKKYKTLSDELKIPIIFVNTGQFGNSQVFNQQFSKEINIPNEYYHLSKEFTEGVANFNFKIPEWVAKFKKKS